MMLKTPHFSTKSYEPKESTHALIHHNYIWLHLLWCIRNTYILINREVTQEIYIILTNTFVFWSWSLMQDYILCTVLCCTHWLRPVTGKIINIQIWVVPKWVSVSWLVGKLSLKPFGQSSKRHLKNFVVNQRQMCMFIKINWIKG